MKMSLPKLGNRNPDEGRALLGNTFWERFTDSEWETDSVV